MPEPEPTHENGPSLNLFLLHSAQKKTLLEFHLPLRPVIDINARYMD
jgi:hypothetical protein